MNQPKRLLTRILALMTTTLLVIGAACAGGSGDQVAQAPQQSASAPAQAAAAPAPQAPAASAAQAGPQLGGVFFLTNRGAPNTVHPFSDTSGGNRNTLGVVYEGLVDYDYTGDYRDRYKIIPELAETWEQTDPTTYIFHIRKGVKFHDGSDLTADDVVWSLEFLRDPGNRFRNAIYLRQVVEIEKVDSHTVKLTTKGPLPTFLALFTGSPNVKILSKSAFDRGVNFEEVAIGTGAFKLVSWDDQSGATYVKNEDYWDPGRPYMDGVKFFYNVSASSSIAAFTARKNDVVKVNSRAAFQAIEAANPGIKTESYPGTHSDALRLRIDRPPFNDPNVRRAVHLTVDRQEMLSTLTFGLGVINPPGINGGRKAWSIPQEELLALPGYRQPKTADLAEARRLLTEAGHESGLEATILVRGDVPLWVDSALFFQEQWKQIGVSARVETVEFATSIQRMLRGDFDIRIGGIAFNLPDPNQVLFAPFSSRGPNFLSYPKDAEVDRLLDAQRRELDPARRRRLSQEAERRLLQAVVPVVVGHYSVYNYGARREVGGWKAQDYMLYNQHRMDGVWLRQ